VDAVLNGQVSFDQLGGQCRQIDRSRVKDVFHDENSNPLTA